MQLPPLRVPHAAALPQPHARLAAPGQQPTHARHHLPPETPTVVTTSNKGLLMSSSGGQLALPTEAGGGGVSGGATQQRGGFSARRPLQLGGAAEGGGLPHQATPNGLLEPLLDFPHGVAGLLSPVGMDPGGLGLAPLQALWGDAPLSARGLGWGGQLAGAALVGGGDGTPGHFTTGQLGGLEACPGSAEPGGRPLPAAAAAHPHQWGAPLLPPHPQRVEAGSAAAAAAAVCAYGQRAHGQHDGAAAWAGQGQALAAQAQDPMAAYALDGGFGGAHLHAVYGAAPGGPLSVGPASAFGAIAASAHTAAGAGPWRGAPPRARAASAAGAGSGYAAPAHGDAQPVDAASRRRTTAGVPGVYGGGGGHLQVPPHSAHPPAPSHHAAAHAPWHPGLPLGAAAHPGPHFTTAAQPLGSYHPPIPQQQPYPHHHFYQQQQQQQQQLYGVMPELPAYVAPWGGAALRADATAPAAAPAATAAPTLSPPSLSGRAHVASGSQRAAGAAGADAGATQGGTADPEEGSDMGATPRARAEPGQGGRREARSTGGMSTPTLTSSSGRSGSSAPEVSGEVGEADGGGQQPQPHAWALAPPPAQARQLPSRGDVAAAHRGGPGGGRAALWGVGDGGRGPAGCGGDGLEDEEDGCTSRRTQGSVGGAVGGVARPRWRQSGDAGAGEWPGPVQGAPGGRRALPPPPAQPQQPVGWDGEAPGVVRRHAASAGGALAGGTGAAAAGWDGSGGDWEGPWRRHTTDPGNARGADAAGAKGRNGAKGGGSGPLPVGGWPLARVWEGGDAAERAQAGGGAAAGGWPLRGHGVGGGGALWEEEEEDDDDDGGGGGMDDGGADDVASERSEEHTASAAEAGEWEEGAAAGARSREGRAGACQVQACGSAGARQRRHSCAPTPCDASPHSMLQARAARRPRHAVATREPARCQRARHRSRRRRRRRRRRRPHPRPAAGWCARRPPRGPRQHRRRRAGVDGAAWPCDGARAANLALRAVSAPRGPPGGAPRPAAAAAAAGRRSDGRRAPRQEAPHGPLWRREHGGRARHGGGRVGALAAVSGGMAGAAARDGPCWLGGWAAPAAAMAPAWRGRGAAKPGRAWGRAAGVAGAERPRAGQA